MGDIALQWSLDAGGADIVIANDDVLADDGLRTAVLLSLFTDRRAEAEDPLPGEDDDRRGWWADEFAEDDGDRIGSRLWLLNRGKNLPGTSARVEALALEALSWLLEDRVASAVDVDVTVERNLLSLVVTITRPQGDLASFRFGHTWDGEASNAV